MNSFILLTWYQLLFDELLTDSSKSKSHRQKRKVLIFGSKFALIFFSKTVFFLAVDVPTKYSAVFQKISFNKNCGSSIRSRFSILIVADIGSFVFYFFSFFFPL